MYSSGRSCVSTPAMRTSCVTGSSSIGPTLSEVPELVVDRARRSAIPIRERADAQHDLAHDEGLDDIVVGADLEAQDAVLGLALGGQHEDADVGERGVGADLLADLVAGRVGQVQIEQDDIGRLRADRREALGAARGPVDRVARGLEVELEEPRDVALVFDDDHPTFHWVTYTAIRSRHAARRSVCARTCSRLFEAAWSYGADRRRRRSDRARSRSSARRSRPRRRSSR